MIRRICTYLPVMTCVCLFYVHIYVLPTGENFTANGNTIKPHFWSFFPWAFDYSFRYIQFFNKMKMLSSDRKYWTNIFIPLQFSWFIEGILIFHVLYDFPFYHHEKSFFSLIWTKFFKNNIVNNERILKEKKEDVI